MIFSFITYNSDKWYAASNGCKLKFKQKIYQLRLYKKVFTALGRITNLHNAVRLIYYYIFINTIL